MTTKKNFGSIDGATMKKLVESQYSISQSLEGINTTLKAVNDFNVLHDKNTMLFQQIVTQNQTSIIDKLKEMTGKYWVLILALIAAVVTIAGYPQLVKLFTGG